MLSFECPSSVYSFVTKKFLSTFSEGKTASSVVGVPYLQTDTCSLSRLLQNYNSLLNNVLRCWPSTRRSPTERQTSVTIAHSRCAPDGSGWSRIVFDAYRQNAFWCALLLFGCFFLCRNFCFIMPIMVTNRSIPRKTFVRADCKPLIYKELWQDIIYTPGAFGGPLGGSR